MKMEAGMDTGPVFTMRETRIGEEESAEELGARLALMGADALVETLNFLEGDGARCPRTSRVRPPARRSPARTHASTGRAPRSSWRAAAAPSPRGPASLPFEKIHA